MPGKIEIADDLTPDDERETLLHELLHHIFNAGPFSPDESEPIIAFLSPILYDSLRRNRDLVEWLLYDEAS